MSRIIILSPYEIKKFDNVPLFNDEERHKFFYISASIKVKLNNLSANDSKVGFVLQLGYFKATGKFYHKYNDDDKLFVSQLLAINLTELNNYTERIRLNHKSEILGMLNHKQFNKNEDLFGEHIENLVSKQMHPRKIIFAMVDLLRARKIEVPNYDKFVRSITTNINKYENNLVLKVADNITDDNKYTLNSLLESDDSKYMITKLKVINQSVRPSRIKQSISGFILIKKLYEDNEKLIKLLDLSREATKYYANWIIKAKISQIKTITDHNTRYLYLLAFLDHQYKNWQDIFIDTILKVNQQYLNKIEILAKESKNELADRNNNLLDFVLRDFDKQSDIIDQVRNIIYDEKIDNNNKVNKLKIIVSKEVKKNHDNSKIDELKQNLIYYKQQEKQNFVILNKLSRALQNRLADIIKHIEFVAMDEFLNKEILYYQNNNLTKSAPNSFLEQSEIEAVYNNSFNSNLYKILLFMKIAEAIKSGEISLANSYRYMSIESYLIKEEIWQAQKEELLKKLDLQEFMDIDKILKKLRTELDYKYSTVNKNLKTNKYIKLKEDGDFSLLTPPVDKPDYDSIYKIMEHDNYISILQMMSEVNNITDFSNNFKHHKIKGVQQKIADEVIFAGIFALGSNIGIHKLASTAIGVNYNNLLHGINWHFSLENLYAANNVLIDFMSKMWLPNQFKKEQNFLHTSSDGKKKCVSAESLNSNYSYKYFGHGRGSNIYTFIDERNILFYSTVFSSSERDAAYVIDGLQHNSSIKSDIHSTDTEGYTELVFGISYLIKISYGPRIKNLGKQLLTSFDKQNPEYQISPDRYVNEKYIKQYWDTILRLIATILLREEKASTIMKRLSSYDKQHKLYSALKEFGRIIKTCFILDIIDNVKLRQQIAKQLNKSELSNKFQGAISFANQELVQIDRDEQEKAAICQVILQNIIVLWNYVKLTKLIMISDNKQRPELMENIMNGSILTWKHVNMLGTYDFSNLAANENINVDELLNFNIA